MANDVHKLKFDLSKDLEKYKNLAGHIAMTAVQQDRSLAREMFQVTNKFNSNDRFYMDPNLNNKILTTIDRTEIITDDVAVRIRLQNNTILYAPAVERIISHIVLNVIKHLEMSMTRDEYRNTIELTGRLCIGVDR